MGNQQTRQEKIEWFGRVFEVAKAKNKILDRRLVLSMFALECRSTMRTGLEILNMFDDLGKIKLGTDGIVVIKK